MYVKARPTDIQFTIPVIFNPPISESEEEFQCKLYATGCTCSTPVVPTPPACSCSDAPPPMMYCYEPLDLNNVKYTLYEYVVLSSRLVFNMPSNIKVGTYRILLFRNGKPYCCEKIYLKIKECW